MATCPDICPANNQATKAPVVHKQAGMFEANVNPYAAPYIPGSVVPRQPILYPKGAPPSYLPQPTDASSGDILGMSAIGPWASGHPDWTPQAGMTGVRPVVDKYSMTRYSTGQWRKNNLTILTDPTSGRGYDFEKKSKKAIADAYNILDIKMKDSNVKLNDRIDDLTSWRKKVRKALNDITEEVETLDMYRMKLKSASRILMMPEAISRECLDLRTHRLEPDLVRDDAEQELVKEVAIVAEIRRVFTETLAKAEDMMKNLKAAKASIESDWSDKTATLKLDKLNQNLGLDSSIILLHPGAARWTENSTSLEYWEHYCAENIRNCKEIKRKSEDLRADLMTAIVKGGQDLKQQCDRTNQALGETVQTTREMCAELERKLKENLQQIADVEKLIEYLKESLRNFEQRNKLVMTRLKNRNYERPNVESCRDVAQQGLVGEAKLIKEKMDELVNLVRNADGIRSDLMQYRGQLEKNIAVKRKSLLIDDDRCSRVRAWMPTPEEFAEA